MKTTTKTTEQVTVRTALYVRMTETVKAHMSLSGSQESVKASAKALSEERVRIVQGYEDITDFLQDIGEVCAAFPTGGQVLKERKQTWKRSFALSFNKVYKDHTLTFNEDTPIIKDKVIKVKPTEQDLIKDLLTGLGVQAKTRESIFAMIQADIDKKALRIEDTRSNLAHNLELEKAAKIATLQAQLAELENIPLEKAA